MHYIDTAQLKFIIQQLRDILDDIEMRFGKQVITSLYRIGDTGVHGTLPLRGIDLRCRDVEFGNELCEWVNSRWVYDSRRPEMVVAMAHGKESNYHIHLQAHPETRAKK